MKALENIYRVSNILFLFVLSTVICTFNIDVCLSAGRHNTYYGKRNFLCEETVSFMIFLYILDCSIKN